MEKAANTAGRVLTLAEGTFRRMDRLQLERSRRRVHRRDREVAERGSRTGRREVGRPIAFRQRGKGIRMRPT